MRKTKMAAALTASVAAIIGVAAAPASAAGRLLPQEWIVSGNTNADSHYNASGTTMTFRDLTTGTPISCTGSTALGFITNGTHTTGAGLATVNSTTFTGCAGSLGLSFTVSHSGVWLFNATTYDQATGVTGGTVSDIAMTLSAPGCSAQLTGSAPASYTNSSHQLTFSPTGTGLHFSTVSGCFNLIGGNDVVVINGFWVWVPPILIIDP